MAAPRVTAKTKIFELDIVLEAVEPPVRRRVQIPGEANLAVLHEVVQAAMGWTNSHLHEFEIDGQCYGMPDPDWDDEEGIDESEVLLSDLVGQGACFHYVYDFGDNWSHRLTVEKITAPEPGVRYPRCVCGQEACPPEDVGGVSGYDRFLAVLADSSNPQRDEYLEWVGGSFDPHRFEMDDVDRALRRLAWRPLAPVR
jgi:hypothetical protein